MDPGRVVVRTLNSVYEVSFRDGRFRRTQGDPARPPPLAKWWPFSRVGPIIRGEPMRFWHLRSRSGRVSHLDLLTTAPVVDILETGPALDPSARHDGGDPPQLPPRSR